MKKDLLAIALQDDAGARVFALVKNPSATESVVPVDEGTFYLDNVEVIPIEKQKPNCRLPLSSSMTHRPPSFARLTVILSALLAALTVPAQDAPRQPAVLCVGAGHAIQASGVPDRLARDFGIQVGAVDFDGVNLDTLRKYNAVVFFCLSRLNPDAKSMNHVEIGPEGFDKINEALQQFLSEGGGIYFYGVSFVHMGDGWSNETLNKLLKLYDAQVLFEELRDEPREKRQPDGQQVLYALANRIETHPATGGIKTLWYAAGPFSYGPWTRPLQLSADWKPLIRTSEAFKATPVDPRKGWTNYTGAPSAVKEKSAVIYAARDMGSGRVILSGGESTISFFGYGYSPFADEQWGRVGMEKGLDGKPSEGLKLLAASLRWLAEPSLKSGSLGGFQREVKETPKARVVKKLKWLKPEKPDPYGYIKGAFGCIPAGAGGNGTVAEYVKAGQAEGLGFVVIAGDYAKMDPAAWDRLVADCRAASSFDCAAIPGLLTEDDQNNRFLQIGPKVWPRPDRLSKKDPKRVQDHLGYWMNDCNFPFRTPYWFSKGQYPTWLHSGYDTFAIRTYENGKLVDDQLMGYLLNEEQGDRCRLVVMNLTTSPAELAKNKDFTFIRAPSRKEVENTFLHNQFSGGAMSYVSSGPRVDYWFLENGWRDTAGLLYVPGTERWRALLKVTADAGLKQVTIYDHQRVFRRFALSGKEAEIQVDGLHDNRHVLVAVVEDVAGGRAVTGGLETSDRLMAQYFCSDRCNIMSGVSTIRTADGREEGVPATSMLYKAGRLYVGTVARKEELPGIDGSGGGTQLSIYPTFYMTAEGDKGEERSILHQINRPYESADIVLFDTPILKRSPAPDSEIFGHAPYVDLAEPKAAARLVQYHFYRKPVNPAPVMYEMSMTITDPAGVQLKKGWNDFSIRYGGAWGTIKKYAIVRTDGTREEGPSADEKTGTAWRGTLKPGDFVLLPDLGEGLFLLDGEMGVVIECTPSKKWFRLYVGRFDTPKLPANTVAAVRLLNLKTPSAGDAAFAEWTRFRDAFGIAGGKPAYAVTPTQGKVVSTRYLLELAAENSGWEGTIGKAELPQNLPAKITGLNDHWTAARVNGETKEWFPIGVVGGTAYTTVDPRTADQKLYIGNLVTADKPDVWLTLIRDSGKEKDPVVVDVHNPTAKDLEVNVTVPVATFLAEKQTVKATVPKGSTVQVGLK